MRILDEEGAESAFGQLVRRHRERVGMSQNGLAAVAGTDPGTVNRLESGKRAPVNRALVERIAAALSLAPSDRDVLLGAAGHLPEALARLGPADRDLLLIADTLSDTGIPREERDELRLVLRVLARKWRGGQSRLVE